MNLKLVRIGDEVTIRTPYYDDALNGRKGFVAGLTARRRFVSRTPGYDLCHFRPGEYDEAQRVIVRLLNREEVTVPAEHLKLQNQKLYRDRFPSDKRPGWDLPLTFKAELPEMPVWEEDLVEVGADTVQWILNDGKDLRRSSHPIIARVMGVDYSADPIRYRLLFRESDYREWIAFVATEDLRLYQRGPTWDLFHGLNIRFEEKREADDFLHRLGYLCRVGSCSEHLQAVQRVEKGLADCYVEIATQSGSSEFRLMNFNCPELAVQIQKEVAAEAVLV